MMEGKAVEEYEPPGSAEKEKERKIFFFPRLSTFRLLSTPFLLWMGFLLRSNQRLNSVLAPEVWEGWVSKEGTAGK